MNPTTQTGSVGIQVAALNGSGSHHVHNALPAAAPAGSNFPPAGSVVPQPAAT